MAALSQYCATHPTGVSPDSSPTRHGCHFSFTRCQLAHLMPLRRCSWEKLFWWTWEDCHNSIWVDFWSHSFYTPSLSQTEIRQSREIKNKQKDNPRPGTSPDCLLELLWICIWFMIGFAMKGHTKTSSVISPISHLLDLSCDNMTALSRVLPTTDKTSLISLSSPAEECQYFALHWWSASGSREQQTVTSRHSLFG